MHPATPAGAGQHRKKVPSSLVHVLRATVAAAAVAALGLSAAVPAVADQPVTTKTPTRSRASAPTFQADYLGGVTGSKPQRTESLAGTWDFTPLTNTICTGGGPFGTTTGPFVSCVDSPADSTPTTIQVPGGGWLKQGYKDLSEATYSKDIRIPEIGGDQVTRVNFGAINHRATVSVDGKTVGTQVTSYTNSIFDISDFVRPGRTHRLEVKVEGRKALVGPDGRYTVPEGASWSDDVAQGIFRSADVEVFPAVFIQDTAVRTSVDDKTLSYDVYLTNSSAKPRQVNLRGDLSSANRKHWKYPRIADRAVTIPAGTTRKVTIGPLTWKAGTASYWQPNVPFQAGYRAQLHDLDLSLTTRGGSARPSASKVRFGFRQFDQVGDHYELNGVPVNLRGDSLQGANYDNIDYHGISDAYDTLPGFLKPSRGNGGWPKAVANYQRLNYNVVRIHQIPATPYMLDVADELGLMIIDETAIRGSNNRENFEAGRDNMIKHLSDLVVRDRNHASVIRWSQANEPFVPFFTNPGAGPAFDEDLYKTVMALDATRPVSTDGNSEDLPHDNYSVFCHYDNFSFGQYTESICAGPAGKPQGQGEFLWYNDHTPQGMTWVATASMRMREQGADDTRPYTLLDSWSSVIPGVKRTDFSSLETGYPNGPIPLYGEDNLPDPWSNPRIRLIQTAFNPVAAIDSAFWNENKLSNEAGEWPIAPSTIRPGSTTRNLTVFNDTLTGERVNLTWKLRSGSAKGRVVDSGNAAVKINLGSSRQIPVTFDAPAGPDLYLQLEVTKPGQGKLFNDTSTVYRVLKS